MFDNQAQESGSRCVERRAFGHIKNKHAVENTLLDQAHVCSRMSIRCKEELLLSLVAFGRMSEMDYLLVPVDKATSQPRVNEIDNSGGYGRVAGAPLYGVHRHRKFVGSKRNQTEPVERQARGDSAVTGAQNLFQREGRM